MRVRVKVRDRDRVRLRVRGRGALLDEEQHAALELLLERGEHLRVRV